jgi:uncharacterized phage protein (TIGR02216 family)
MTPRELEAALSGVLAPAHGSDPPSRAALSELMRSYPDG